MRLLDLFCGAGGAAEGYWRAGFDEIVGIDIDPQPDYQFESFEMDITRILSGANRMVEPDGFDFVHASPPCQAYTPMSNRHGSQQPELVDAVREWLDRYETPYAIENVRGAPLHNPITLTGEMFGLRCHRPRLFELGGWYAFQPPIPPRQENAVAVYGKPDGRRLVTRTDGSELRAWSSVAEGQQALGIDWTDNWHSIREAVPPAYTEWIGKAFLEQRAAA